MQSWLNLLSLVTFALSLPIRREVPQEHSHEKFLTTVRTSLNLNNPDQIKDPVFALLGNAAAAQGAGNVQDLDCLQQAVADRAFTNAKQASDVDGQVAALIFRALERNTGKVGLASAPCTSLQAVNPEIAAIQQHQDPASDNAASINKQITLELARQIAAIGGDPLQALESGTFEPGDVNDPTAAGHTCDDANDPEGCIFTQNLLVPDATENEIQAAVSGSGGANNGTNTGNGGNTGDANSGAGDANSGAGNGTNTGNNNNGTDNTGDVKSGNNNSNNTDSSGGVANNGTTSGSDSQVDNSSSIGGTGGSTAGQNLQTFTGALGGATAPAVKAGGKGFIVEGSDEFKNIGAALQRSCDIQHNQCANIANSQAGRSSGLTVNQCDQQNNACRAAAQN
ncbi:hypothetical protein AN958_07687 [Leucoagaricus sp. SymC.cos]|nr:hypothetical protein AN958_07687 [Leucoagaricus sp. SymC.cos]